MLFEFWNKRRFVRNFQYFPGMQNDFNFTSLEKVLEIANELNVENNFKYIQLPLT